MTRLRIAALIAVASLAGAALAVLAHGKTQRAAPPRGSRAPRPIGPEPARERIAFTLVLRLPGASRLRSTLAAIDDPHSSRFHQYIDPRSFGSRFGISTSALARLERELVGRGFRITQAYPQRTALGLTGSVSSVQRLLHVRLLSYVDAAGRRAHAPDREPVVPLELRSLVSGATGLDTRPRWRASDVPMGALTPPTLQPAYDISPLRGLGIAGQGMTIAIISFSAYDPSDPAGFASQFGLTGPAPRVISVDGGTSDVSHADEANLDIDIVRSVAPAAQILVYEVPQSSSSYTDAINRIVQDRRASIISSSWGQCELLLRPDERAGDNQALAAAHAAGVSMFVATGDQGAYDCQGQQASDLRLSVDWPASSANAIAVGGTRLNLASDGSYLSESGWDYPLSEAGGGGGFTSGDPRPPWQTGPGVPGGRRRGLPDVSADADPGTGWLIYWNGQFLAGVGGTSASAPFWAGAMLLVSQFASRQGAGRLGFVNPMLYALAASKQRVRPFHDVTFGGNRYYQAAPGWDPATGLGSPDVYNLARDTVAYLRSHSRR